MKPDKKADDLLREKLNSYSSPLPAGLFDAMDKKREKQQAAGLFGWRVKTGVSAMVLLLGIGFAYWQMTPDTKEMSTTEFVSINSNIQSTSTAKELAKNNQTQVIAPIQNELSEQEKTTFTESTTEENELIDNTQQQTKLSNSSASFPTNVVKTTTNKSDVIQQIHSIKIPTESKENSFNSESLNESVKENVALPSDNVSIEGEEKVALVKRASQSVLVSPLEGKDFFASTNFHAAMPKVECGWQARKVYLYFDAITSLDMAFRTLTPKVADGEAYAILRNQTEGMQESMSLGFRASAVTKAGLAVRTGLIYSTIKEPFSQRIYTEYEEYIETTDQQGNLLSRDTITRTEIQKFEYPNRHKLLDVPVIFGYEIDKDKYNIGLNAGAYINITTSQKGRFLTPANEIVDFSTNSATPYEAFKANVGVSLYSSIAVNYKITPSLHFIFEPYGRYFMNSFTTNNHELEQNYFVAGMQVGLRMKM